MHKCNRLRVEKSKELFYSTLKLSELSFQYQKKYYSKGLLKGCNRLMCGREIILESKCETF